MDLQCLSNLPTFNFLKFVKKAVLEVFIKFFIVCFCIFQFNDNTKTFQHFIKRNNYDYNFFKSICILFLHAYLSCKIYNQNTLTDVLTVIIWVKFSIA